MPDPTPASAPPPRGTRFELLANNVLIATGIPFHGADQKLVEDALFRAFEQGWEEGWSACFAAEYPEP